MSSEKEEGKCATYSTVDIVTRAIEGRWQRQLRAEEEEEGPPAGDDTHSSACRASTTRGQSRRQSVVYSRLAETLSLCRRRLFVFD